MRRIIPLAVFALILIATIVVAIGTPSTPRAEAEDILMGLPSLDGFQVYFAEANGEASRFDRTEEGLSRLAGLIQMMGADLYTLEWRTGIPDDADLLIMAGPRTDMSTDQAAWLWAYLQNGGRLLLIADPMIDGNRALSMTRSFFDLVWSDMGIRGRNDVVVAQGELRSVIPPTEEPGDEEAEMPPAEPVEVPELLPNFTTGILNPTHPITANLTDELVFFAARSLEADETPREAVITTLISSSSEYYGETEFGVFQETGFAEYNIGVDTTRSELSLAAAYENAKTGTRLVLIGDRDFATNHAGLQTSPPYSPSFLYPGNVRFLLNAVSWLLNAESVEMTFPTPGPTVTPTITPSPTPITPTPEGE